MSEKMCHCGKPLHYSDLELQKLIERLVESSGEHVEITVADHGTWLVPRHYIALHGIKAVDIPNLGFERID